MKKILYIIPILLLTLILSSNVYGYTTSDYGNIKFDSISEMYDYLENKGITFDKTINYDYYNTYRDDLINSDLFKEYIEDYPYYIFSGTSIYMFNKIPTFHFEYNDNGDGTFYIETNIVSDGKFNMAQVYFTTGDKITSAVRDNLSYCRTISPSIKFSTKFYNRENLSFLIKAENFDFLYTGTNENIIVKNPEFSFIPTYTENYKSCNLKLDIINEPENYTLQYAINSSSSEWREFDNSVGVTVENNCLLIVRMLDVNGDEIFANSYNVAILEDMLSTTYFRVNFDNSQKQILGFTPILFNNASEQFDIYFSYNSKSRNEINSGSVAFKDTNNAFTLWDNFSNSVENFFCGNGKTYYLKPNGDAEIVLTFKIVNKHTGITALTRTFKFYLTYDFPEALSSSTNGKDDVSFSSGAGTNYDDTSFNNPFANLDKNSDLDTIMETAQESFTTFKALFSILPGFIWAFIISVLGIFVVLRIVGR